MQHHILYLSSSLPISMSYDSQNNQKKKNTQEFYQTAYVHIREIGILNTSREIVVCLRSSGHPCQEEVVILVCKDPNFQCLYSQCQSNILVKIPCQLQEYRPIVNITSTQCRGSIIVPNGATGPQLPKKRKYPLQVDYQLGNYFKPSHLSSEKFRRKLSYKLKTSVIYSIINFEALFINHGSFFYFVFLLLLLFFFRNWIQSLPWQLASLPSLNQLRKNQYQPQQSST